MQERTSASIPIQGNILIHQWFPTTVGGAAPNDCYEYNCLHSLSNRRWPEKFPLMIVDPVHVMHNKKCHVTVVRTDNLLIVILEARTTVATKKGRFIRHHNFSVSHQAAASKEVQ